MYSIFGIYKISGDLVEKSETDKLIQSLNYWKRGKTDFFLNENLGIGNIILENSIFSQYEKLPLISKDTNYVIVFDGRIDNRNEIFDLSGLNKNLNKIPDSELILEAFIKKGKDIFSKLIGDFAFVIWDNIKRELICARDFVGAKPFYYYHDKDIFIFASEVTALLSSDLVDKSLDEQYIADLLSLLTSEKSRTFFKNIKRLVPGHYMVVNSKGKINIEEYWRFELKDEIILNSEKDYVELLREKVTEAIKCRLNAYYPIGCELSGGIDSPFIAAIAHKTLQSNNSQLFAFSHIMHGEALHKVYPLNDEREYIKQICDFINLNVNIQCDAENYSVLDNIIKNVDIQGYPTQQYFQAFSSEIYSKALKMNVHTLLSGFGGDELISYHGSGYFKELATNKKYWLLFKELKSHEKKSKKSVYYRFIMNFLKSNFSTIFENLIKLSGKPGWIDLKNQCTVLNSEFERKMNQYNRVKIMGDFPKQNNVRERLVERISHNHVSERLEYSGIAAKHYEIEYSYPLLDKRIVEFGLSLPSHLFFKNGYGRYIFRKAMEGYLPDNVIWKTKGDLNTTTIPWVIHNYRKDYTRILAFINDMEKKKIGHEFVDFSKMKIQAERIYNKKQDKKDPIYPSSLYSAIELLYYLLNKK